MRSDHSLVSDVIDERCDLGGGLEHEFGDVERLGDSPPRQPHRGSVRHHFEEKPHLEHDDNLNKTTKKSQTYRDLRCMVQS